MKNIFAIVGYTNWGKSNTLYEIFERGNFWPLKSPIQSSSFPGKKFTVINASNEDRPTTDYLERLESVLKHHHDNNITFVITVSLIFEEGHSRSVIPVIDYLNQLKDYNVHYIVLNSAWFKNSVLEKVDISSLESNVENGTIEIMEESINESSRNFTIRTNRIIEIIKTVID